MQKHLQDLWLPRNHVVDTVFRPPKRQSRSHGEFGIDIMYVTCNILTLIDMYLYLSIHVLMFLIMAEETIEMIKTTANL